jgi:ABC-type polysaccharide/polyol phosphate transport system ATPase subunit
MADSVAPRTVASHSQSQRAEAAPQINYALELVDIGKKFQRQTLKAGYTTIKSSLLRLFSQGEGVRESEVTHAISNLTIRIPQGASVGIIGRNGSGKSTLLKLISGIYKPDHGRITVHGRVAALIELGAGFHPDFSGRENLFLGGVIHGLTKAQIEARLPDIVKFAELEKVIDDPVRTYSSGMFMRLGFSLAIHTDPDVLIVDEVLAVGDAAFVSKCKERITELRRKGKTLLLVSHDLEAVERWCDEVVWLHSGVVRDRGEPRRVIDHYRQFIEKGEEFELTQDSQIKNTQANAQDLGQAVENAASTRWGSREIEITAVRMLDRQQHPRLLFHEADGVIVEIDYRMNEATSDVVFGVGLHRTDGLLVHGTNTDIEKLSISQLKTKGTVQFIVERLGLLEGNYSVDVAAHRQDGYPYDYHKGAIKFAVRSPLKQVGVSALTHEWRIDGVRLEERA